MVNNPVTSHSPAHHFSISLKMLPKEDCADPTNDAFSHELFPAIAICDAKTDQRHFRRKWKYIIGITLRSI
jgi:hypothetical protein